MRIIVAARLTVHQKFPRADDSQTGVSLPDSRLPGMHPSSRLFAVPMVAGEGTGEAAVEGLNGGVEDASGRVKVAGTEGVGIEGKSRPRVSQAVGGHSER